MEMLKQKFRICVYHIYQMVLGKLFRIYRKEQDRRNFSRCQPPLVKLVDFNNTRFAVYIGSHGFIEDSIVRSGNWSGDLLLVSDYFITAGSAIIEVGANIGFESLYFAKRFPNAIVYSYEPGAYPYDSLMLAKAYNHLDNLKVFKLAVGNAPGIAKLSSPTLAANNKGLGSLKQNKDLEINYAHEEVQVVTLDTHFSEQRRVSLIKIDTQGFEWNVLQGAAKIITEQRPVIIFEHEDQYHDNPKETRQSMAAFFEKLGYDLYIAGEDVLKSFDFCGVSHFHGDIIALPRK